MRRVLWAQDTCYVGTLKGVGRISQQTVIDPDSTVSFAKRYAGKTPVTAADLLTELVRPFCEEHGIPLSRILTDRGTEFWRVPDRHDDERSLAGKDIEPTRTKTTSLQTNGFCERVHKMRLNECSRVAFRKKLDKTLDDLQADLDAWLAEYTDR